MKKQIKRLSLHQNAKVLAILMSIASLFLLMPLVLVFSMMGSEVKIAELGIFVLMPFFYLVFTYIFASVMAWLYNKLSSSLGGFEYESEAIDN